MKKTARKDQVDLLLGNAQTRWQGVEIQGHSLFPFYYNNKKLEATRNPVDSMALLKILIDSGVGPNRSPPRHGGRSELENMEWRDPAARLEPTLILSQSGEPLSRANRDEGRERENTTTVSSETSRSGESSARSRGRSHWRFLARLGLGKHR